MNILLTGGASGLGEAILTRLAADKGNQVFFTFFSSIEKASILENRYSNIKGFHCDFTCENSIDEFLKVIPGLNISILIHNALSRKPDPVHFHQKKSEIFKEKFCSNVMPVVKITQAALKEFRKSRFGKIITILSSYILNKPPAGLSEYVAEKAYLHSLSKSWACEYSRYNITSNCLSPSFMETALNRKIDERTVEDILERHPLKQILTIEETADAVVFLTGCTQQINGINLVINSAENVI